MAEHPTYGCGRNQWKTSYMYALYLYLPTIVAYYTVAYAYRAFNAILNGPKLRCVESITNYCTPMFSYQ